MARKPDPENKRRILRAAFAVMRERGVYDTSMADIAEAAHIDRSTLYWHFRDREALFFALAEHLVLEQVEFVKKAIAGIEDPIDRLYAFVSAVLEHYRSHGQELLLLIQMWGRSAAARLDGVFQRVHEITGIVRRESTRMLQEAIDKGQVRQCDAETVIRATRAMLDGVLIQQLAEGYDPRPTVDLFYHNVLQPLRVQPRALTAREEAPQAMPSAA